MSLKVFEKGSLIHTTPQAAFDWLERPGALQRLTPPWERVEVVKSDPGVRDGSTVELRSRAFGRWWTWRVEHRDYVEGKQFRDVQLSGPFAHWSHLHRIEATDDPGECRMADRIEFTPPGGAIGAFVSKKMIQKRLARMFRFRHAVMRDDLELAASVGAVRRMRVVIAGASGFVGAPLANFLRTQGHEVVALVRRAARDGTEIEWHPERGELDPHALRGADVVINLCGASIAGGRWTDERKALLRSSRLQSTRTLVEAIATAKHRPFLLINTSAAGFYGSAGADVLDEESPRGEGFLADLCADWEAEALRAEELGLRVVTPRFGVVLSPDGGALKSMLPLFCLGLGGRLGPAGNWTNWISRDDLLGALYHCVLDTRCRGAVNLCAPEAVTQGRFADVLGRVLRRPSLLPVPGFALRAVFGQMADEALLSSARIAPRVLLESGYRFRHAKLEAAFEHILGAVDLPSPRREEQNDRVTSRKHGRRRR